MRVLEKLGFSREGTLRKNQYIKGSFVDKAIYGLLREDLGTE
jgi:RimJ/RimL family protein N-acetyltransferase